MNVEDPFRRFAAATTTLTTTVVIILGPITVIVSGTSMGTITITVFSWFHFDSNIAMIWIFEQSTKVSCISRRTHQRNYVYIYIYIS